MIDYRITKLYGLTKEEQQVVTLLIKQIVKAFIYKTSAGMEKGYGYYSDLDLRIAVVQYEDLMSAVEKLQSPKQVNMDLSESAALAWWVGKTLDRFVMGFRNELFYKRLLLGDKFVMMGDSLEKLAKFIDQ